MLQVQDSHPYVYVFINEELSFPQKVVQAGHALIEVTRNNLIHPDLPHPSVIALSLKNESHFTKIEAMLNQNNIKYKLFKEPDADYLTTALATEPVYSDQRKLFKKYQLIREKIK